MSRSTEPPARTLNAIDLQLAALYFPILAERAKDKRTITYGELIERAKSAHPNRKIVQNAVPLGTGRRLDAIRDFCTEQGLPDLSSLVVGGADGEVGDASGGDAIEARRQVFSVEWAGVSADFSGYLRKTETSLAPKAKIKPDQAIQIMWEHYKSNQATIPKSINAARGQIIADILAGLPVEDAFTKAILAIPPTPVGKRAKR